MDSVDNDVRGNLKFMPTNYRNYLSRASIGRNGENVIPFYYRGLGAETVPTYRNLVLGQWASGYVPAVHQSFLNFNAPGKIVNFIRDKVLGGGISLLDNINNTFNEDEFEAFLGEVIDENTIHGGCIAKLNLDSSGGLIPSVVRLPFYSIEYGEHGKVLSARVFIENFRKEDLKANEGYVIVENRYYKADGNGYGRYSVEKWSWNNDAQHGKAEANALSLSEMDDDIKAYLEANGISLSERFLFKGSIGIYSFKNTLTNAAFPQSKQGKSEFSDIEDHLYALDHAFTAKENDKYLGRGRCILPKALLAGFPNALGGQSYVNGIGSSMISSPLLGGYSSRVQLDQTFFNEVPSAINNDKAKPESIQFDLRTEQWRLEIEGILGDIASILGFTSSMFDSRLVGSGQKTAFQIAAEEDLTRATVEGKRRLLNRTLTKMFNDVMIITESSSLIRIKWPQSGLSNYQLLSQTTIAEYGANLISMETAIDKLHPDWDQSQKEEEIKRLKGKVEDIEQQFDKVDLMKEPLTIDKDE